jgi:uncharacterized membrane protein
MIPVLEVLDFVGLTLSLYFTLVFYHVIDAEARFVPRFCRLATGDCAAVVHHPDASVFSVPNSLLGIVYYTVVLIAINRSFASALPIVVVSWFAVAVSMFLIYSLMKRIRVLCVLCIFAHAINLAIALGVTFL